MNDPVIVARNLSKWYGEVIGLNTLQLSVFPGVTGIVGPNGSGKSTLFKLISGLIKPSMGEIYVLGEKPWGNTELLARIGFCPDYDNLSDEQTGREYLTLVGELHGIVSKDIRNRINEVAEIVGMARDMDRKIGGFSKGMRQRMKIAGAMLHKPQLLLLDEPLSGTDPLGRRDIIKIIHSLNREYGYNIIVSSHVLHEVERLTHQVAVFYKGRAVATGNIQEIRNLIDKHPHNIIVEADNLTGLAKSFVDLDFIVSMEFKPDKKGLVVQVSKPDEFFNTVPDLVEKLGCNIHKMYSLDDNLESVFRYLVG